VVGAEPGQGGVDGGVVVAEMRDERVHGSLELRVVEQP
jgi:hypothetical protein